MQHKGFHGRGFISLLTLASFIIMSVTGIVLYFAPQGRIALWVNWKFWGFTKGDWENIHIISCVLFVIMGIWHLCYNWKPLTTYLSEKVASGLGLRRELLITVLASVLLVFGSLYEWPPFHYVLDFSDVAKKAWVISKEYEPPFGHAEELSLNSFTKRMRIDLDHASQALKEKGIRFGEPGESLQKIAKGNGTSPMELYRIMKKFEQQPAEAQPVQGKEKVRYTAERVEEKFSGTGVGRKTLAEVCQEIGLDIRQARERLAQHKVVMKDHETMREAASKQDVGPMDILKLILVDGYNLK